MSLAYQVTKGSPIAEQIVDDYAERCDLASERDRSYARRWFLPAFFEQAVRSVRKATGVVATTEIAEAERIARSLYTKDAAVTVLGRRGESGETCRVVRSEAVFGEAV